MSFEASSGTFEHKWHKSEHSCRKCGVLGKVTCRAWESSCGGYEDYQYKCGECGHTWWVDGIDS